MDKEKRNIEILQKRKLGWSYRKIAVHCGLSVRAVWEIVTNQQKEFKCLDCGNKIKHYKSLRCSKCAYKNSKNHKWAGDKVGYHALHAWVKRNLIKPNSCSKCGLVKKLDLANISQKYKRDLSDWEWLCRRCHMAKDGRMKTSKPVSKSSRID